MLFKIPKILIKNVRYLNLTYAGIRIIVYTTVVPIITDIFLGIGNY